MKTYRKPYSKTINILIHKVLHPKRSTKRIAEVMRITYASVYNTLYQYDALGSDLSHLREVLGKHYVEPQVADLVTQAGAEEVKPTAGQEILRDEINGLNAMLEKRDATIRSLEHQAIGYRSVISYLQGQINGLAV
jgi:hypothetical protein